MVELWDSEEFEDLIVAGLTAMYEDHHVKKYAKLSRWMGTEFKITNEDLKWLRCVGPYFIPGDRLIESFCYDVRNDGLPFMGMYATGKDQGDDEETISGYCEIVGTRRIKRLPSTVRLQKPGTPFVSINMACRNEGGFVGMKTYCTMDAEGHLHECLWMKNRPHGRTVWESMSEQEDMPNKYAFLAGAALSFWADKRFLWNVECLDGRVKCGFGVYESQIKSLFYARQAPLSAAGRRRPILHWVSSHRRRIKEGVDVDIETYLRGVSEFEMNGTLFKITNPQKKVEVDAA